MSGSFFAKLATDLPRISLYAFVALVSPVSHAADHDGLVGIYAITSPYVDREVDVVYA